MNRGRPLSSLARQVAAERDPAGPRQDPRRMRDLLGESARYELWPVAGARDQARHLPPGAAVPIACLPAEGLGPTLALAARLAAEGFQPIPHLAARTFGSREEFARALRRLDETGLRHTFAVHGDRGHPGGPFASTLDMLRELERAPAPPLSVGIVGYPEGHPAASGGQLWDTLLAAQRSASYVVTQLCFDAEAILGWIAEARSRGLTLPVYAGVAGAVDRKRLREIGAAAGAGASLHLLDEPTPERARLFLRGSYNPLHLVDALRPHLDPGAAPVDALPVGPAEPQQPGSRIAGFQVFTFNQVSRLTRTLAT